MRGHRVHNEVALAAEGGVSCGDTEFIMKLPLRLKAECRELSLLSVDAGPGAAKTQQIVGDHEASSAEGVLPLVASM
jgi:hypothetical protein